MTSDEKIQYLANIYYVVKVDGEVERVEENMFEEVAKGIDAGYFERSRAKEMMEKEGFAIRYPKRWSDRIRSMEDMLLVAISNEKLHKLEKKIMTDYAKNLDIDQKQMNLITKETKARAKEMKGT
jgi:uncharacterized tellurite resistance protein B-like protein